MVTVVASETSGLVFRPIDTNWVSIFSLEVPIRFQFLPKLGPHFYIPVLLFNWEQWQPLLVSGQERGYVSRYNLVKIMFSNLPKEYDF